LEPLGCDKWNKLPKPLIGSAMNAGWIVSSYDLKN